MNNKKKKAFKKTQSWELDDGESNGRIKTHFVIVFANF